MKTKLAVCLLAVVLAIPAGVAVFGTGVVTETVTTSAETAPTTSPALAAAQGMIVDEDIEFEPELADLIGCDGLHVSATEEGDAAAHFYIWVWDEELETEVQVECDPLSDLPEPPEPPVLGGALGVLSMVAGTTMSLIDEDIDFEPEVADLVGCDGLHVSATEEGDATAYLYNWVWDEELQEEVKEECDPLA